MKIGIIAAMEVEFNNLLDGMDSYEEYKILGIKFYDGILNDKEVTLSLSGIGKVNAALACGVLINEFKCDFIINTGIAGGTKPLSHKDVVIGSGISYHDFDLRVFGYKYGQVPHMPQEFYPGEDAILLVKRSLKKIGIDYKVAKTDVGGVEFISPYVEKNFLENAENTYYKYVESNIYGNRDQSLPRVTKPVVDSIDQVTFKYTITKNETLLGYTTIYDERQSDFEYDVNDTTMGIDTEYQGGCYYQTYQEGKETALYSYTKTTTYVNGETSEIEVYPKQEFFVGQNELRHWTTNGYSA